MGLRLRVQPRPLKTSNVAWREPFSPGAGGAKKAGEYVILHSAICELRSSYVFMLVCEFNIAPAVYVWCELIELYSRVVTASVRTPVRCF
jgi:hypothetical protein